MAGCTQLLPERALVRVLRVPPHHLVHEQRVLADENAPTTGAHAVEYDGRRASGGERRAGFEAGLELVHGLADLIVAQVVNRKAPRLQEATAFRYLVGGRLEIRRLA